MFFVGFFLVCFLFVGDFEELFNSVNGWLLSLKTYVQNVRIIIEIVGYIVIEVV